MTQKGTGENRLFGVVGALRMAGGVFSIACVYNLAGQRTGVSPERGVAGLPLQRAEKCMTKVRWHWSSLKLGILCAGLCVGALTVWQASAQPLLPIVTNVAALWDPKSLRMEVVYDIIAADGRKAVFVFAEISWNNLTNWGISVCSLSGDAGMVAPGKSKKLAWDASSVATQAGTNIPNIRLFAVDVGDYGNPARAPAGASNAPPSPNLVWIGPGKFNSQRGCVSLSKGFWMGRFEVTQAEYQSVMGRNPSRFRGNNNRPVEQVSWFDAVRYCEVLTVRTRRTGRLDTNWSCRLPTAAEWEYACGAGATTTYSFGENSGGNSMGGYGWYNRNSGGETREVGSRVPNRWGLYDMYGNVEEWCRDWRGVPVRGDVIDPKGPVFGSRRVIKGGSWMGHAASCIGAFYSCNFPSAHADRHGFRVVLAPVELDSPAGRRGFLERLWPRKGEQ